MRTLPRGRSGWAALVLAFGLAGFSPAVGAQPAEPEANEAAPPILVELDFEEPPPSGPDTFRLFERHRGAVDLSSSFRISGARSLRLSEGRRDGCFSEFLGFFPQRSSGRVLTRFYILWTDPEQTFNFGLAGPGWFLGAEQHGQAVWIATRGGTLQHRPAGEWEVLFAPQAFTWYLVDVLYDVDGGHYDLAIWEEGVEKPLLDLRRQRGFNDADRSSIRYYSFIGDLEDEDEALFYVDDLVIATDPAVRTRPFVAPGRRSFFVDSLRLQPPSGEAAEDLIAAAIAALRELDTGAAGAESLAGLSASGVDRLEMAADLAFAEADLELAERLYGLLRKDPARADRALLKLADVYFLRGDVAAERDAREAIYGRLELEEIRSRSIRP